MKKGLLSIAAGLLISFGVSAQYVDANWQVLDNTTSVTGMKGLVPSNGYDGLVSGTLTYAGAPYVIAWEGDVLAVTFTNPAGANWADFGFITTPWTGGTGKYFTTTTDGTAQASDIAQGFSIDMTDDANKTLSFKVQADAPVNIRVDLGDIQGKLSNGASPKADFAATVGGVNTSEATKWTPLTFSWAGDLTAFANATKITDMYSGAWWGVDNTGLGKGTEIPLDATKIVKVAMTLDDGPDADHTATNAADGAIKKIYIKDLTIGDASTTWVYVGLESISGAELKVVDGVVYSAGTITVSSVSGQVIATAQGQLNIDALPAGVLIITAAEGTAKIVK